MFRWDGTRRTVGNELPCTRLPEVGLDGARVGLDVSYFDCSMNRTVKFTKSWHFQSFEVASTSCSILGHLRLLHMA